MTKIWALHGGGDWCDASADYLVLPDGVNIEHEKIKRDHWYFDQYVPALRRGERPEYLNFADWLKKLGAREPTIEELEIFPAD